MGEREAEQRVLDLAGPKANENYIQALLVRRMREALEPPKYRRR